MANSIVTTATTLEGQAFEIAQALQKAEEALTDVNQTTIDPNIEELTVTLSITLPISFTTAAGGTMNIVPGTYL